VNILFLFFLNFFVEEFQQVSLEVHLHGSILNQRASATIGWLGSINVFVFVTNVYY
jgi:hypothetical protein